MAETYCGKTCAECSSREEMNCPGCKLEPGRPITGDCPLARCCREKGHETCSTCSACGHCNTHYNRYQMPQRRQKERQAALEREQAIAKKAPFLGKWMWILFWLVVPSTVFSLLPLSTTPAQDRPYQYSRSDRRHTQSAGARSCCREPWRHPPSPDCLHRSIWGS